MRWGKQDLFYLVSKAAMQKVHSVGKVHAVNMK